MEKQTAVAKKAKSKTSTKKTESYGVRHFAGSIIFTALFPDASVVQIAGDFNDWHPERTSMEKTNDRGVWRSKLRLNPGTYRYRLVVDGKWQHDPFNTNFEPNPYGELNSVLTVK